jgi:hypothetical protein
VPKSVDVGASNSTVALAHIAQGLLKAGILEEEDYIGLMSRDSHPLVDAINNGISRLATLAGIDDTRGVFRFLKFVYTDDVQHLPGTDWQPGVWLQFYGTRETRSVGAFGLQLVRHVHDVVVGEGVERLEKAIGKAAWDVYDLTCHVFRYTTGLADPKWANSEREEDEEAWDERDPEGVVLAEVPKEALFHNWQAEPIRRARVRVFNEEREWAAEILADAEILSRLVQEPRDMKRVKTKRYRELCHLNCFENRQPIPVLIQWHKDDWVDRFMDDHNEMIQQVENTDMVWMIGFDLSQSGREPGTLWWAIETMRHTLAILALADRILYALTWSAKLINNPAYVGERIEVRA